MKVLMFHNVAKPPKSARLKSLYVKPDKFEKWMRILSKLNYKFVKEEDLAPKGRGVLLTFDDAYKDFLENAFPVIKELRAHAIVFVPAGLVGQFNRWDFKKVNAIKPIMSWDELSYLVKAGIEIGSHTLSHPFLTKLSIKDAKREIEDSKKLLEDKLGVKIKSFCYPYGDYNQEIAELVREAGYEYAYTTVKGKYKDSPNRWEIKRIYISGYWTTLRFLWECLK
ncbi:polysaccharide deacetylase family protein [Thermocrinis sp.]